MGLQLRNLKTVGEWFIWSSSRYFCCRLLSRLRWLERDLSTLEHLKIFLRLGNISDHNCHQLKLVVSAATTSAVASLSPSSSVSSSSTSLSESIKTELDSVKNFTPGTARRRRNAKKFAGKKLAKVHTKLLPLLLPTSICRTSTTSCRCCNGSCAITLLDKVLTRHPRGLVLISSTKCQTASNWFVRNQNLWSHFVFSDNFEVTKVAKYVLKFSQTCRFTPASDLATSKGVLSFWGLGHYTGGSRDLWRWSVPS